MAENKHIKDLKIGGVKASTFGANIKNSIKYTVEDVSKELFPIIYEINDSNEDLKETVDTTVKTIKNLQPKKIKSKIKKSSTLATGKKAFKNAKKDIKKGIFNNRKRGRNSSGGFDDDFDLGEFGFDDNDFDFEVIEDDGGDTTINVFSDDDDEVISTIKHSATASIKVSSQQHAQQMAVSGAINDNIAKLVAFQNESTLKHYEETAQFYANVTELQKSMKESLLKMIPVQKEETEFPSDREKIMSFSGAINIPKYLNTIIKKNLPDLLDDLTSGSYSLTKSVLTPEMLESNLENFKNNPLGVISANILKAAIPKTFKSTMEKFNESLFDSMKTFAMQMNTYSTYGIEDLDSDLEESVFKRGIKYIAGKLFKMDDSGPISRLDTARYEKGKVDFDGVTKKAITEVIPMYLRKILSSLQGTKDEIIYDYEQGKAQWASQKRREFEATKRAHELAGNSEARSKISHYLSHNLGIKDVYDNKDFQNDLEVFTAALQSSKMPRINSDFEIEKFRSLVTGKKDVDGKDAFRGDEQRFATILSAYHAALTPQQKLELAGNGFDGRKRSKQFMDKQQSDMTLTGMGQVLGTESLSISNSLDYRQAVEKNNLKAQVQLQRQGKASNFLTPIENSLTDIKRILLEGIVVYDSSRMSRKGKGQHSDELEEIKTQESLFNEEVNKLKMVNEENAFRRLKRYEEFEAERLKQGLNESFLDSVNDNMQDDINQLAREMLAHSTEFNKPKKGEVKENKLTAKIQQVFKKPFDLAEKAMQDVTKGISLAFYGSPEQKKNNIVSDDQIINQEETKPQLSPSGTEDKFKTNNGDNNDSVDNTIQDINGKTVTTKNGKVIIHKPNKNNQVELVNEKEETFKNIDGQEMNYQEHVASSLNMVISRFDKFSEQAEKSVKEFGKKLIGNKNEYGGREGGILSSTANMFTDSYRKVTNMVTGNGTILTNGSLIEERENSLNSMVRGAASSLKTKLIGMKNGEQGLLTNIKDKMATSFDNFQVAMFGDVALDKKANTKKLVEKYAPNAIFGGSLGLVGSMFLPGGPLLGAAVGSLTSMGAKSGHLSSLLFGTEEGGKKLFGKEYKGLLNTKLGLKISESFSNTKDKTVGLVGSMFSPSGPLLGTTLGKLAGMVSKVTGISEFAFGKDNGKNPKQFIKNLKDQAVRVAKKIGWKGLTVGASGLLGSMFLPGGPIISGLMGAFLGNMATKKQFQSNLKRFLFGDFDPNTGQGRVGQLTILTRSLRASIVNPLKNFAISTTENARYWMEQNVFIPMKYAFKPFTDLGKHIIGKGEDMLKKHILTPITNRLVRYLDPVRKAFSFAAKKVMSVITTPFKFLTKTIVGAFTGVSNLVRQFNATHGIGGGDEEHEFNRQRSLENSKKRHEERMSKINKTIDRDEQYASSVHNFNKLQIKQAKAEKKAEKERRKYIFSTDLSDLTDEERARYQELASKSRSNVDLMIKNFRKSDIDKAQNRDIIRQNNAEFNAFKKEIQERRAKKYSERNILDKDGNLVSQEELDRRKSKIDKIAEKSLEHSRIISEYEKSRKKPSAKQIEDVNDASVIDTANSNNRIAENTDELKGLVRKIVDFMAGKHGGNKKSSIEETDVVELSDEDNKSSVEEVTDKLKSKPKQSLNRDNSSAAFLHSKKEKEREQREIESHENLEEISQNTEQTNIALSQKGGFGKAFGIIGSVFGMFTQFGGFLKDLPSKMFDLFDNIKDMRLNMGDLLTNFKSFGKKSLKSLGNLGTGLKTFKDFAEGGVGGVLGGSIETGGFLHDKANKLTSKGLKKGIDKIKEKGVKETTDAAVDTLGKTAIGKGITNFLNLKPVQSVLGSKSAQALQKSLTSGLVGKLGKKATVAAGKALLKAPLTAAFVTADLVSGASDAKTYFKIPADGKATLKMRTAASIGKAIANNVLFGLIEPATVSNLVYNLLADENEENDLQTMQQKFRQEAELMGISEEDYNNQINEGWTAKTKNFFFGAKDSEGNYRKVGLLNPMSWFGKKSTQPKVNSGRGNFFKKHNTFTQEPKANIKNFVSNVGNKLNPAKAIKDSLKNPVISSLVESLKPLYGNASPIIAPALLGLTLSANGRILDIIAKASKGSSSQTSGTNSSLENNVAARDIIKTEEVREKKSGKSFFGNIVDKFKSKFMGKGGNTGIYTGRGTNNGHTYFSQLDPKWANQSLSNGDNDTVGSAGCGPTAVAMALRSHGVDTDPSKAAQFASAYKVKNQGVTADFISDYGAANGVNLQGRSVDGYSANDIDVSLASGQPVVALGRSISGSNPYTSSGHYVTISGKDSKGNYLVSDPLNANNNNKSYSAADLLSNTSAYWTDSSIDGSTLDMSSLMGYGLTYSKVIDPKDGVLTSRFGPRTVGGEANNHTGIDYGTHKKEGKNIYAVADGEVIKVDNIPQNGKKYGYGTATRIKHPDGTMSLYAHLQKNLKKVGDQVKSGELIGLSGNTGWSTGPHLHFEMRDAKNKAFDPLPVVEQGKLPNTSQVIEEPNNFERADVNKSSGDKLGGILGTIANLFKGIITGDFGDESDATDSTTAASNTSGASAYPSSIKDLNWLSKTTGQKGDGPLIEMAARFETGGADVGKISSGSGDYGGKSYGLPQYTYKANGVAGKGSLKTYFMEDFMAKNKDSYPNVWKALSGHEVYSKSFDSAWKNLASSHYDEFYQAQSDSAVKKYYEPIRSKLESQGYDVGRQPKAIHSAILSRGIQVFNRTHDTLFPQAFKRIGLSAKEASNHPSKVLNALYQVQLDKVDGMFRSSSSSVRNSLRNNRFSLNNPNGEYAYANEILKREMDGVIYRPDAKQEKATTNGPVKTTPNKTQTITTLPTSSVLTKGPDRSQLTLTGRGKGGVTRNNFLSRMFGAGKQGDTNIQISKKETPSVVLNNYMEETSSRINSTVALDFITQNMNLAFEQVISLLGEIRDASKETASNTKTISEKESVVLQETTGNSVENTSNININDNRRTNVSKNKGSNEFFLGNMQNSSSDPASNLKRRVFQIAQG